MRSLVMTDPVDAMIGDTHGKFACRDAGIPLFRFGFPVFDRVNKHRYPIIGYQGAINMVTEICNKFIDSRMRRALSLVRRGAATPLRSSLAALI